MTSWPSVFIAIFTDHIRMVRILPISNDETEITAEWLFREATLNDPHYDKNNVIDFDYGDETRWGSMRTKSKRSL